MEQNETLSGEFMLATALANGANVSAAAEQAGMGRTTAYRWLAKPEFRMRVAQLQQALIRRALSRMGEGMADAADTLRDLLKDANPDVRYRAARALLDLGPRLRETVELEARVVDLEQGRLPLEEQPS